MYLIYMYITLCMKGNKHMSHSHSTDNKIEQVLQEMVSNCTYIKLHVELALVESKKHNPRVGTVLKFLFT